ncbi:MAG: RNB domain-containing ribonuclease [Thermoleophilia bacterium]|nr:RNB domain-containing ribonuclease [Thermoleophilia bacterium]
MSLVCCQLVKHARYVAAHPWFEPGATISLGNAKHHVDDIGQLALVQAGARNVGRVVEVLGSVDSIHAVMRGLLAEEGLLGPDPAPGHALGEPSPEIARQLDELPTEIPFLDTREDRRSDLIVTIDPPTAKDFDDAIGIQPADADDHAWKLWVHIADVSAYVPTGSPIDLEAIDRAMSAYVPGTVAPMLPHALSSDLCSLRPGVDRGCVSVCADLDTDGSVVRVRFARTVVRSARRLSYDQVDDLLERGGAIHPVIDELLHGLDGITRLLRDRRMQRGALDMALPDVEFTIGDDHPEDARMAPESRSHRLVEECMLVANDAVGQRLAQAGAPGIWRIHDHPDPAAIEALMRTFEQLGVPTPPLPESFGGADAAQLASEAAKRAQRYAESARRGRVTFAPRVLRALQQAVYRARSGPHSGLATHSYAHFTSPIRRYPDLVNHRSLLQLIGASDEPVASDDIAEIAQHVSAVERELQQLERRADKITLAYLLHRRLHTGTDAGDDGTGRWAGEVNGLIAAGMFVRFGGVYEGFVPARTISPDERYQLDDMGLAMVGTRSGHRWRLGDQIVVYVDRVDRSTGKVDLRLVPPERERRRSQHRGGGGNRYRRRRSR